MPGPIAGASFTSFGRSVTTASVVVINDETLKAKKLVSEKLVSASRQDANDDNEPKRSQRITWQHRPKQF
jgi:hypothetical protein